jgi:hypothetical protein
LVPLNRGATRRVIARLVRESRKPGPSLRVGAEPPSTADLDAQFDALIDGKVVKPSALQRPAIPDRLAQAAAVLIRADRSATAEADATPSEPPSAVQLELPQPPSSVAPPPSAAVVSAVQTPAVPRAEPPPPRASKRAGEQGRFESDPELDASTARARLGLWVFAGTSLAAVGLLLVYFTLGRQDPASALGRLSQPSAASAPALAKSPAAPKRTFGDLQINSHPARAQVLLLIGPGPTLATDLNPGVAQEFVAIADGYVPARALVPADAVWEELDGRPRYELAIQATPLRAGAHPKLLGLGPTLLPRDVGAPKPRVGDVRVVTTPRAANVYQLIGFTPEVRVENVPTDRTYELIVYLEGRSPVTQRIGPEAFQTVAGKRVATLDVSLE